jgi:transcriptional regulator with XRE-family HTH domain
MGRPRQARTTPPPAPRKLRLVRWLQGVSLPVLSAQTTIPISTLSRIERGETRPNEEDLNRLVAFFGIPGDILLQEIDIEQPQEASA